MLFVQESEPGISVKQLLDQILLRLTFFLHGTPPDQGLT
jgi:hypothetical protein